MPQVSFTDHTGTSRSVRADAGDSVMETAVRNGVPGIVAECGGSLSCATCHVFVDPDDAGALPPLGDLEDEMLHGTAVDRRAKVAACTGAAIPFDAAADPAVPLPSVTLAPAGPGSRVRS